MVSNVRCPEAVLRTTMEEKDHNRRQEMNDGSSVGWCKA
jgi:hypothetical protein